MKNLAVFTRRGLALGVALGLLSLVHLTRAAKIAMSVEPDKKVKVEGTFRGGANKDYTLEWFFTREGSCSENKMGPPLMFGRMPVTTNSEQRAAYSFDFTFPNGTKKGKIIVSATDDTGSKTEFKACHDLKDEDGFSL
jgi:hypothetical protein